MSNLQDNVGADRFSAVLREVLASLLAPELSRRILDLASNDQPLSFDHASDALSFVVGPLLRALELEVGPTGAVSLVNDIQAIFEPLIQEPPRSRRVASGRQLQSRRSQVTQPAMKRVPASGTTPARTTQPARAAQPQPPSTERATPPRGLRRTRAHAAKHRGFEDVPTADLPEKTLDVLRGRDTLGPPARADSLQIILSSDEDRAFELMTKLEPDQVRWIEPGEESLLRLLSEGLPDGTVFVVDCVGGASPEDVAQHLSMLPRRSTVIVWGSEDADLNREELAALGFLSSSADASPSELAEMLHGLRAA